MYELNYDEDLTLLKKESVKEPEVTYIERRKKVRNPELTCLPKVIIRPSIQRNK